jgi:hypothetical protein
MAYGVMDLSQSLPLRLLRVRQMQARSVEPLLFPDFAADLEQPMLSPAERSTSIERLLHARTARRVAVGSLARGPLAPAAGFDLEEEA